MPPNTTKVIAVPSARPGRPERRRHPRRCVHPHACAPLDLGSGPPEQALAVDLSPGGVRLLLSRPPRLGATLAARFLAPSGQLCWVRRMRVVHLARLTNGSWRVGCRFLRPLAPGELRAVFG